MIIRIINFELQMIKNKDAKLQPKLHETEINEKLEDVIINSSTVNFKDTRSKRYKGKHGYSNKERMRIYYIKEKKEKQKYELSMNPVERFKSSLEG